MPDRPALISASVAVAIVAIGAVLLAVAWAVFSYEVALGVLVATLTLATAATVLRLLLTDDES